MHKLNKTIALVLAVSLLGQNALFAAPAANAQYSGDDLPAAQQISLQDYQAQAREDLRRDSWLKRNGLTVLAFTGTSVALLTLQKIFHNRQIRRFNEEIASLRRGAERKLQEAQGKWSAERQTLENQMTSQKNAWLQEREALENELQATRKQLKLYQIKTNGLHTSVATQRGKLQNQIQSAALREHALQAQLDDVNRKLALKSEYLEDLTYHGKHVDDFLDRYNALFEGTLSDAEKKVLRDRFAREEWLTRLPETQRQEFMKIIDKTIEMSGHGIAPQTTANYLRVLSRQYFAKQLPAYEYLTGLSRRLFSKSNIFTVGLVLALGAAAQPANAQSQMQATRIQNNFDLFLNATPEELAVMEQDEELRRVCIQGAKALHLMTRLTPEEKRELQQGLPSATSQNLQLKVQAAY